MKRIIRQGTFETNSSSSHSLVVTKQDEYFTHDEIIESMRLNNDGVVNYYDYELEFDRTPDSPLYSFYDKLRYLIASYSRDDDKINEILNAVKEIAPEIKEFDFPISYWCDERTYYGYVDHQSYGIINSYLNKNNISFKEFLTNKRYIIILDGDEYCMWDTMKNCGLINKDFIQEEYNSWE